MEFGDELKGEEEGRMKIPFLSSGAVEVPFSELEKSKRRRSRLGEVMGKRLRTEF